MSVELANKIWPRCGWVIGWLLISVRVAAGALVPGDTCRSPNPPVITGTATSVCRDQSVTLTATGCVGTVVWSNGATGSSITLQPQQTTKYTAICRAQPGCISCFAEVWKVSVTTPDAPTVTASASLVCPGQNVTLTATGCTGLVRWSDRSTGSVWRGNLTQTTIFQAVCEQNECVSNPSRAVLVQVALPSTPRLMVDQSTICVGQSVALTASGCMGTVRWNDGGYGPVRAVMPLVNRVYRAVCQVGTCQSDSAIAVAVTVHPSGQKLPAKAGVSNGCPFQTADLSKAIPDYADADPALSYSFQTGPSPASPMVQSPGAVEAGTYYLFGRTADGCYTDPSVVSVTINACPNAIPPCLSNPATVAIQIDSLDWARGVVRLHGRLGGSAQSANWQSGGGGLFADTGLNARYLLSETDRQRRVATFTLTAPDPDGNGPCRGASATVNVKVPSQLQNLASAFIANVNESIRAMGDGKDVGDTDIRVFIPQGFSPNGDGLNDRFVIQYVPAEVTIQLDVYNRWGQLVYRNLNYKNDWDGTANQGISGISRGQNLPDGTYYYQVQLSDGREFTRFLTLAR